MSLGESVSGLCAEAMPAVPRASPRQPMVLCALLNLNCVRNSPSLEDANFLNMESIKLYSNTKRHNASYKIDM